MFFLYGIHCCVSKPVYFFLRTFAFIDIIYVPVCPYAFIDVSVYLFVCLSIRPFAYICMSYLFVYTPLCFDWCICTSVCRCVCSYACQTADSRELLEALASTSGTVAYLMACDDGEQEEEDDMDAESFESVDPINNLTGFLESDEMNMGVSTDNNHEERLESSSLEPVRKCSC